MSAPTKHASLLRAAIMLPTPLWLTMLCLLPMLSAPFPQLAQNILGIEGDPSIAQDIFGYVRASVISPSNAPQVDGLSQRETAHLDDVSALIRGIYLAGVGTLIVDLLWSFAFGRCRNIWRAGLRDGAILTFVLLTASTVFTIFAWDSAFFSFHQVFFASGSWQFRTTSTLIRNFPPRFWSFAALSQGGLMVLVAGLMLYLTRRAATNGAPHDIAARVETTPSQR